MREVFLSRGYDNGKCTLGMLKVFGVDHEPIYTLEEPWKNNEPKVSCVPTGTYLVRPHNGMKWQGVWALQAVTGRTGILIHTGNTVLDIEGCILVGMSHGRLTAPERDRLKGDGHYAVRESRVAFNRLREAIGGVKDFMLTIQ